MHHVDTDSSSDSDDYFSFDEDDNSPDPVKSSDLPTMTNDADEVRRCENPYLLSYMFTYFFKIQNVNIPS